MSSPKNSGVQELDYIGLNSLLNLYDKDGKIQFDQDKAAARAYFLEHVNKNMVFSHSLREKLDYLVENGYYEKEFLDKYTFGFIKRLFQRAYAKKYRFETFVGAYKFYSSYALKTFDGRRYLERYEDRVCTTALYLADGDEKRAVEIMEEIISNRFQPATPTFLNAGKKSRGEMVSCFEGNALVDTIAGPMPIKDVEPGMMVLTHDGTYCPVTTNMQRVENIGIWHVTVSGSAVELSATSEHPVLAYRPDESHGKLPVEHSGDGATERAVWTAISNLHRGDFVAASYPTEKPFIDSLSVLDFIQGNANSPLSDITLRVESGDLVSSSDTNAVSANLPMNADLGAFIGYYLSAGRVCVTHSERTGRLEAKCVRFTFEESHGDFAKHLEEVSLRVFGVQAEVTHKKDRKVISVMLHSKIVGEFLLNLVGTGFNKKYLPEFFVVSNEEFGRALLTGMFRGDSCMRSSGVCASMLNPALVNQLKSIALRLGVLPDVEMYSDATGTYASIFIPGSNEKNRELIFEIGRNVDKFTEREDNLRGARWVDGYAMYPVVGAFFESGSMDVYNLEVEANHTYSVHGHVVHNCFLIGVEDDLNSIGRSINSALQLSKRGGGVAFNLTDVRASGDPIKKIENQSSGVLPIMKLYEDSFSYANQLGARQGAGAVYLHAHHMDIETFLDTRKENADEKIRIKTLSLGVLIPNITLELARKNENMYLFSPYDVEKEYGKPFSEVDVTAEYYAMVDNQNIRKKKISARGFLQKIAEIQFQSGYPYLIFIDNANDQSPIAGKIKMSNLCVEIFQVQESSVINPDQSYATVGKDISCNLGSMNIALAIDSPDFAKTIETSVRALTQVSDMSNIDVVPTINSGNQRSHAIGLGAMNLHGALAKHGMMYGSEEALDFTNIYFYSVAFYAIRASMLIAKERGRTFDNFENSKYASGEFFDKYIDKEWGTTTEAARKALVHVPVPTQEDWKQLKSDVQEYGMYNQNLQAVPPTGSISYINNSVPSILPATARIEVRKEGKMGRVYYPAPHMTNENVHLYKDAYELGNKAIIDTFAVAQQHIDQGMSLTLFFDETATTKDLNKTQTYAWLKGIKSLYYTRIRKIALEGTDIEGCVSCAV